ncbi:MAG TPA: TadE/TadG family type IV pilus assembly protein, partial [Devosia sp.]|nr:TadE/TadG family type IV pilus assembly protein [Devosia sp.]
ARLGRDTQGATIVEFAIILLPLCVVLMGGLDLGYQSYVRSVLQGSLNDVTRAGSMEAPELTCNVGTVEAQIKCSIETKVNSIARNATYDIQMKNFFEFSGVGRSEKLVTDHANNGVYDPGDCWEDINENGRFDTDAGRDGIGGADDIVFYEVTVTMPRLFPVGGLMGISNEYNIIARSAIRNQPWSSQKVPPTVCE